MLWLPYMKKRTPPTSPEDKQLFEDALKGTKRIVHDKVNLRQQRPAPKIPKKQPNDATEMTLLQLEPTPSVTGEEALEFARNGISERERRRLRQGHFTLDASLDLHGYTGSEAEVQLMTFITRCVKQQARFVRIIHGQGYGSQNPYPVIKNLVNQILRSHPMVLAFNTCLPHQGGRGAVNILLKHMPN